MPNNDDSNPPAESCIDCGAPITEAIGGIAICESCLETRGSCCPEFGAFDLTTHSHQSVSADIHENASPVCYASQFEGADKSADDTDIRHDRDHHRFHSPTGAHLDYLRPAPDELDVTHTFVPESARGKGLAGRLMEAVIHYAEAERLQLRASCSYGQRYLERRQRSR